MDILLALPLALRIVSFIYSSRHQPNSLRAATSALTLNIHFHMLWLDGVYEDTSASQYMRRMQLRADVSQAPRMWAVLLE